MARGHQVDVAAAQGLQFEHDGGEFAIIHLLARFVAPADGEVLTETAAQAAAGEKDGARAAAADEYRLLTEMRAVAGDAGATTDAAAADFAGDPVDPAAPRAQGAAAEQAAADLGPALELTAGVQAGGKGHGDSPSGLGDRGSRERPTAGRGPVHRRTRGLRAAESTRRNRHGAVS